MQILGLGKIFACILVRRGKEMRAGRVNRVARTARVFAVSSAIGQISFKLSCKGILKSRIKSALSGGGCE